MMEIVHDRSAIELVHLMRRLTIRHAFGEIPPHRFKEEFGCLVTQYREVDRCRPPDTAGSFYFSEDDS